MHHLNLLATSAVGLEAVVARELKALGYEPRILQTGRIAFVGDETAVSRANLWLRTADRVLVQLGSFEATDFGQLFDQTFDLPWHDWLPADAEFPLNGRSVKSQLSSVPACQKIVKKAIVEKLKKAHHATTLPETGPRYTVEVALLDDRATLTLDTSGPSLHKRGYRRLVGEAQLKETLAGAAIGRSLLRFGHDSHRGGADWPQSGPRPPSRLRCRSLGGSFTKTVARGAARSWRSSEA